MVPMQDAKFEWGKSLAQFILREPWVTVKTSPARPEPLLQVVGGQ